MSKDRRDTSFADLKRQKLELPPVHQGPNLKGAFRGAQITGHDMDEAARTEGGRSSSRLEIKLLVVAAGVVVACACVVLGYIVLVPK